jgi:DNA (cytosine-5)-methyltransferase 1
MRYGSVCSGIEAASVAWSPLGWSPAFFSDILSGNSAPRRQAGQGFAADVAPSIVSSGRGVERAGDTRGQDPVVSVHVDPAARCVTAGYAQRLDWETENFVAKAYGGNNTSGPINVATAVNAHGGPAGRLDFESETFVAHPITLAIRGRDGEPDLEWRQDGTANAVLTPNGGRAGIGVGAIAHAIQAGALRENPDSGPDGVGVQEGLSYTLEARAEVQAVSYSLRSDADRSDEAKTPSIDANGVARIRDAGFNFYEEHAPTLDASSPHTVATAWAVRRLTPMECERLQGFPDGYTLIPVGNKMAADGPRYKALGNSMAINCMRWIGQRIQKVEAMTEKEMAA